MNLPGRRTGWRELNRRGFLAALASSRVFARAAEISPSCTLSAEQEEGPFYVDGAMLRRDITEAKPGVPLALRVTFFDAKKCAPLTNAAVDIWHCDAGGVYSGFTAQGMNRPRGIPPGPPPEADALRPSGPGFGGRGGGRGPRTTDDTRFLRGVQITNEKGLVEFATVYPGWYAGRTIHIHMKVHVGGNRVSDIYAGGHVSHTGQLFFPEDLTEQVARVKPYIEHTGVRRTPQTEDMVFRSQHGSGAIVRIEKDSAANGYIATASVAVDPELTPAIIMPGMPGRGRPPV